MAEPYRVEDGSERLEVRPHPPGRHPGLVHVFGLEVGGIDPQAVVVVEDPFQPVGQAGLDHVSEPGFAAEGAALTSTRRGQIERPGQLGCLPRPDAGLGELLQDGLDHLGRRRLELDLDLPEAEPVPPTTDHRHPVVVDLSDRASIGVVEAEPDPLRGQLRDRDQSGCDGQPL